MRPHKGLKQGHMTGGGTGGMWSSPNDEPASSNLVTEPLWHSDGGTVITSDSAHEACIKVSGFSKKGREEKILSTDAAEYL